MSKSMKNEEAISCLMNFNISFLRGNGKTRLILALKKAIAALEKQIPKKPEQGTTNAFIYVCPNCGGPVGSLEVEEIWCDFCPKCGQAIDKALDWSDEK